MGRKICFIDDDDAFEIPLFVRVFGEEFDLITATNFTECRRQIEAHGNWAPDLFVLDMYFPSGLPEQEVIRELVSRPVMIPEDRAEIRQAYINFLAAKERLGTVLAAWKQEAEGGIRLAEEVHAGHPHVPIVLYSRKATAEDVLRCMTQEGVLDVISKPTGRDDADTENRTRKMKEALCARFRKAMDPSAAEKGAVIRHAVSLLMKDVGFFSRA